MNPVESELVVDLGEELAEFRASMRDWIGRSAPPGLADLVDWYDGATILAGSNRNVHADALASPEYAAWERALVDEGLIYPHWPVAAGGKGWTEVQTAIFAQECERVGVPRVKRGFSADLVGTALLSHGTAEQQAFFLPRIVAGTDRYCQGFSEPNHGSDLAGVTTRGVVDGDEIVVTGQKVWTSAYEPANMIFVLCRTDPAAPRRDALSFVLLPFGPDNNIEVRGIRQMTGAIEFAEDFLDGARAPLFNVIGGLGNGWAVAMSTLATERGADLLGSYLGYARELRALIDHAHETGAVDDPLLRQRLARAYVDVQIMRAQAAIALSNAASGQPSDTLGFVSKLQWSEYGLRLGQLAVDVAGVDGIIRPDVQAPGAPAFVGDYRTDRWQDLLLSGRGATIFSGSNEIQRNIIAEQVLQLPREPRGIKPVENQAQQVSS